MDKLKWFISTHNVDCSYKPANADVLDKAEKAMGVTIGAQLKRYLVDYGYLGYGSVEFYCIIQRLGLASDMVRQTKYLHECFPKTNGYIAFGTHGDGIYILVDSSDVVYIYDTIKDQLSLEDPSISHYILNRLLDEGREIRSD